MKKKNKLFTRKEVRILLKAQVKRVGNSVGRMDWRAGDDEILRRISKCSIIKF